MANRLAPRGHERSAVRHAQQTAYAPGPQTIGGQARPSRRLTPPGHKRPAVRRTRRTAYAPGPQTTGGQAHPENGLRPRATNDRQPSATPVRLPPAGHERPAVGRAQRTAYARGPQTTGSQARHPYGLRPRATNDRQSGAPSRPLTPPGHKRPAVRRALQTAYAPGPQTIDSRARGPYGVRPRATNDRRSGAPSGRLAPSGHKRQPVPHSGPSDKRLRVGSRRDQPRRRAPDRPRFPAGVSARLTLRAAESGAPDPIWTEERANTFFVCERRGKTQPIGA